MNEEKPKQRKSLKLPNPKISLSLSSTTKWILTVLVLGVGVVLVVVFYTQQQTRNDDLKDEVSKAAVTLVANSQTKADLEQRLTAANLKLTELTAGIPASDQSMDVEEAIYSAADQAGVAVSSLSCTEPKEAQVGKASYRAFSVSLSITGEPDRLLAFTAVLGQWLPSASIESVSTGEAQMALVIQVYALAG